METIVLVFYICAFFYGYIKFPHFLNPLTIFFGLWTIIIYASGLQLYDLYATSDKVYGLILIGGVTYLLGFMLGILMFKHARVSVGRNNINRPVSSDIKEEKRYVVNYKLVYFFIFISILFYLNDLRAVVGYLLQGASLGTIRVLVQSGSQYMGSGIQNALRILIVTPFASVIMILAAADFFAGKKNKLLYLGTGLILGLKLLTDGSRSRLVYLIMSFVICWMYTVDRKKGISFKKKLLVKKKIRFRKRMIFVVVFLIFAGIGMYYITLSRSGERALRDTYYYLAMEPIMLEKWCEQADQLGIYGFGAAAINGFLFPLFYIITNVFKLLAYPAHWRSVYNLLESVGTDWQVITSVGTRANSYASVFFTFYVDCKTVGVALGMLLYGLFVANSYVKVIRFPNIKNLSVYCLILIGIFYTFIQFMFKNIYYAIAYLFFVFIVFKREEVKKDEDISCDT